MQMAATTKFPEADSSPTLPGRMLNLRRDESESGICGDSNLEEFTILQENYAVLCNTMTDIDDLLKYFVAEKIITLNEEEEIKSSATKSDKVRKLLLNISGPLKAGNNNGFYTMLKIMKDRGTKATQNLATFLSSRITTKDVPLHEHFESVDDIQKTSDYLRNRYTQNRYIPSTDDNWLPYHPKHYTPLTFVHHEGRRTQSEMDEIAAMMVSTEIGSDGGSKGLKKVVDLCLHFDVEKASPYKILIEGAPGIGKTVLSKEIALQWAEHNILKQRCMLFLLFIRDQEVKKISDLQSLVKYFCQDDSTCTKVTKWLKETNGRYLTIVVDGYDEASKDDNIIHLINNGIIGRTVLTECGLVITSRPAASSHLHDITDCRVEVLGFAEEDRIKFINDALKDEHKIKELEKFLTSTPFINTLCYIPLYMSILLCLIEGGVRTLPKTQTNLLKKFIVMTIVHFLNKTKGESITEITSLDELPATYNQAVKELSHFAFIALQEDKLVFTKAEVNKACPNLTPSNNWYILGLLIPVQYFKPQDSCHHNISFHFLHLSIQEYLAAYHITYLSSDKRLTLLQDTFLDVHYANVWVMYFGIKGSNDGAFKQFICDSRFQSTVINWFQTIKNKQKAINIKSTILNDKIKCLHLLHCLTESEDCEVLSSVVSIFRGKCFDLSNQSLSYNDMYTLAVVLKKLQPNEQWDKLDLSRCNIDGKSCNILCNAFQSKSKAFNFKVVDISNNNFYWESLNRLCKTLSTKELVLSPNALYDSVIVSKLHSLTAELKSIVCQNSFTKNHGDELLLLTFVENLNKIVTVYSSHSHIEALVFSEADLTEKLKRFNTVSLDNIAFSYLITDSQAAKKLALLSSVERLNFRGKYLHSHRVYFFVGTPQLLCQYNSWHSIVADYLSAVICHNIQHEASYLRTIEAKHASAFERLLQNTSSITTFNVAHSGISAEAADDIAAILSNNTKLQELYLNGNNLQTKGIAKIAKALQHTAGLKVFDISNNDISDEAADDIAVILSYNTKLQILNIERNNLQESGIAAITLPLIKNPPTLTTFNISKCNISDEAAYDVATIIEHITTIQHLDISRCNLQELGFLRIATALKKISNLTVFNISNNNIDESMVDHIVEILSKNIKIIDLQLAGNKIDTDGTIKIANIILKSSKLRRFTMSDNKISNAIANFMAATLCGDREQKIILDKTCTNSQVTGAMKIARNLQNMSNLSTFAVYDHNITSEVVDDMATVLSYNNRLKVLILDGCYFKVGDIIKIAAALQATYNLSVFNISRSNNFCEAVKYFSKILSNNPKLQGLYLRWNNLQTSHIITLAKSLQNLSNLKAINISNNKISTEAANSIAKVLSHNTKLQKLHIDHNNLQASGITKLVEGLQGISTLTAFGISSNNIGMNEKAADSIAALLSNNCLLQSLHLGTNHLQTNSVMKIVSALQHVTTLSILDLSNNNITFEAVESIAVVLSKNDKLKELYIGGNALQAVSIRKILQNMETLTTLSLPNSSINSEEVDEFASCLLCCTKLQKLILSECNLQTVGVTSIANSLLNTKHLTVFNISNNTVSDEVSEKIAAVLSHNPQLQELHIAKNNFTDKGAIEIFISLHSTSTLTVLNISNNSITFEATDSLVKVLSKSCNLKELYIAGNRFETTGAIKIALSLQKITSLTKLNISNNGITEEAADHIATVLTYNTMLQELQLARNSFGTTGALKILSSLKDTSSLTKLNISYNNITDDAAEMILNLASCRLQDLQVTGNSFDTAGALKIARLAYLSNLKLRVFNITNNKVSNAVAEYMAAVLCGDLEQKLILDDACTDSQVASAIKIASTLQNVSNLTTFAISHQDFKHGLAHKIAAFLSSSTQLKVVHLEKNNVQCENIVVILKALAKISSLKVLHIVVANFSIEVSTHIAAILTNNTQLEELRINLESTSIKAGCANKIAQALKHLLNVTMLSISNNIANEAADDIAKYLFQSTKLLKFHLYGNILQAVNFIKIARALLTVSLLEALSISNIEVHDLTAATCIVDVLSHNAHLKQLNLDNNNLQAIGTDKIAQALQQTSNLTVFTASKSNVGIDGANHIAKILQHNTGLQILDLGENNLESTGAIVIVKAMKNNLFLKVLNISNNYINNEALDDITAMLCNKSELEELHLQNNDFAFSDAIKIANSIPNFSPLRVFNVTNKHIHEKETNFIRAVICNHDLCLNACELEVSYVIQTLQDFQGTSLIGKISIINNVISDEAANEIARILSCVDKLQMLHLDSNKLQPTGMMKIVQALQNNATLLSFGMLNNVISEEVVCDIATVLSKNTILQKVYVDGSGLNSNCMKTILKALRSTSLTVFSIANNNICMEEADDIAAILSCNNELNSLLLHENNLQSPGIVLISKALRKISNLTVLNISKNNIGSDAADDIATLLFRNKKLQCLYADGNNFQSVGVKKILASMQNNSLKRFGISNNNITDEAVNSITQFVRQNTQLQELKLDGNNFDLASAIQIAIAVQNNSHLSVPDLFTNITGDKEIKFLHNVFEKKNLCVDKDFISGVIKIAKTVYNHFTILNLSDNIDGGRIADDIAELLYANPSLKVLNLKKNNLQTEGAIKIARGLCNTITLTQFNISKNNIGSQAANDIANVLSCNTRLEVLYLDENCLQTKGASKIAKGLQNIYSLKIFSISCNQIDAEAAGEIANALNCNRELNILDLSGNSFQNTGIITIAKTLKHISSLTALSLSRNRINSSKAAKHIGTLLSYNTNLQVLNLHGNHLQSPGVTKIAAALKKVYSLTTFDISRNGVSSEAANDIADLLAHNTKIELLYIDGNNLRTEGIIEIARALQNSSNLKVFNIANNNTSVGAANDIANILTHNTNLQELYFSGSNLQTEGIITISKKLLNISTLTVLNISNNNIGLDAAKSIADALFCNKQMETLELCDNELSSLGAMKIAIALRDMSTLKKLYFSNNKVGDEAASDIAKALSKNTNLIKLRLSRNNFQVTGALKIVKALKSTSTLQFFDISQNNLGERKDEIIDILSHHQALRIHI